VIERLVEHAHVFAPDLRGHGRSTWTPGSYRLFDFAADIETFMQHVVPGPAIVLGHSLGGEVAMIAAAERPDLVRAVINEDGPLSADGARSTIAPTRPMLLAMRELAGSILPDEELERRVGEIPIRFATGKVVPFGNLLGWDHDALADSAETLRIHDPTMLDAVLEFAEMHAGYDETVLRRIECPVVILQADPGEGGGLTDAEVERAMALLPDARRIRFEGLGHSIHMDDPEWFLVEVLPLLEEFS
jgi:pimeloyl-ACP methyl ester carboxylesterase